MIEVAKIIPQQRVQHCAFEQKERSRQRTVEQIVNVPVPMTKEEMILFPAMRAGGGAGIEHPIAVMRADHDDHAESISLIRKLTADLAPPEHACGSWRSLYGGTATLLEELAAHIALENDVLFPRFEPAR